MTTVDYMMLRDHLLNWIFDNAPALLEDDVLMEGFLHLVCNEVIRAVARERARLRERLEEATTG